MKKLLLLLLGVMSQITLASNSTGTNKSTATLSGKCEITATDLNFGQIIPGAVSSEATGTFNVKCTKSTTYQYYIGNSQWGTDCPYMSGKNSGDRIVVGIKDLQINNFTANNNSGTGGANGTLVSRTGTGSTESLSFQAIIQSQYRDSFGRTFSSCATTYKAPGVGYNPYVTPDIYSGTMTFGIIY